ncbi:alkaline phosphatase family protein [Methylobacterium sp. PvR107]|uniref:alkaline phosphatase family protein n=1 Tax=Methylobacterium sp. PvR107 TaxID=2806597 RepID=UPI001AE5E605|nr:alkaline phosphatase family protein [Methylobacterium sp. PvR107]MBP1182786.1 putative AlkP superfamily pyrophosphatase or phosphodiesterase [Methylobacterium sp. PvR107]
MRRVIVSCLIGFGIAGPVQAQPEARNVVLFIADGLRAGMVNGANAPTMDRLMRAGVRFTNTHSLFPTFTMPNATAMATGHLLGDTGQFGNTIYTAFPVPGAGESLTPFLESDPVLGDVDAHFASNYLNEETILRAAHAKGLSTASIGKLGPSLVFDHTARSGQDSILVDDSTGRPGGIPLSEELRTRLGAVGLPVQAPTRGANGQAGTAEVPGTLAANVEQQGYFTDVATKAVLPLFKARGKPFVLVFWSRDPDGTQHNQGDSLGRLVPGINGPTSLAAIHNADTNLATLLAALNEQGLSDSTDVILTSDHGFSTISKESATSFSATQAYKGVPKGQLPPGFLAVDLAHDLGLGLFDPDAKGAQLAADAFPSRANGLLGTDPAKPDVVVAANGGSDLVYLPSGDKALARKVVEALSRQDYVSGLFVSAALGPIPGALPLSAIALDGSALTPMPAIVVNFRSFSTGCSDPTTCGVEVSDTGLQQGQGMHGSFSRADTRNVMGARGPSFRAGHDSPAPASNADLGQTIAHLLGLTIPGRGHLVGRVLTEALKNGSTPTFARAVLRSDPDAAGHVTVLAYQTVGQTRYFDAAGYPGRTLGLDVPALSAAAEAH